MMRHAILGPGGVGGLIGAVLAHAGEDVTLIVRPGTEQNYPRELSLDSPFGKINAPVSITTSIAEPCHLLWITVKATQLEETLNSVPKGATVQAVVPLLNGIDHVEKLRQRFGRDKVLPATITVESERIAPGKIVQKSPFVRFNVIASGKDFLTTAIDAFRHAGFECNLVESEGTLLWSKLVFLAPVALSTTAARSAIGNVLNDALRAARLESCVREACAVAEGAGATVDANAVLTRITALPPSMRSSMEKDVANGNPPELDAIGGPILRGAEAYGIPVPATSELVRVIQANLKR